MAGIAPMEIGVHDTGSLTIRKWGPRIKYPPKRGFLSKSNHSID